jgi:hypothetical protein
MQKWFNGTTPAQKVFLWVIGVAPMVGLGLTQHDTLGALVLTCPPVLLLIYLQLGTRKGNKRTT